MVCVAMASCKEETSKIPEPRQPRAVATSASTPAPSPVERAAYIRSRIEKFKEWGGGHSPVPHRAINANTFAKVRQEVTVADTPALLMLIHDPAGDVRSMAGNLLGCLNADADRIVQDLLSRETANDRRSNLMDAQIEIRGVLSGGSSCP